MSDSKLDKYATDFEAKPFWTSAKIGLFTLIVIFALGVAGSLLGLFSSIISAPSRVANKTLETNNIIESYEWFYDVNAGYEARSAQVSEFVGLQAEATSDSDKSKLRTELSAMRQSCRGLVTKYNANSQKMNKSIFKGWSLPDTLPIENCEKTL